MVVQPKRKNEEKMRHPQISERQILVGTDDMQNGPNGQKAHNANNPKSYTPGGLRPPLLRSHRLIIILAARQDLTNPPSTHHKGAIKHHKNAIKRRKSAIQYRRINGSRSQE
jgi:hypothetical protein